MRIKKYLLVTGVTGRFLLNAQTAFLIRFFKVATSATAKL